MSMMGWPPLMSMVALVFNVRGDEFAAEFAAEALNSGCWVWAALSPSLFSLSLFSAHTSLHKLRLTMPKLSARNTSLAFYRGRHFHLNLSGSKTGRKKLLFGGLKEKAKIPMIPRKKGQKGAKWRNKWLPEVFAVVLGFGSVRCQFM
jgi:hypothetical protein